jgi:hypothetical protein
MGKNLFLTAPFIKLVRGYFEFKLTGRTIFVGKRDRDLVSCHLLCLQLQRETLRGHIERSDLLAIYFNNALGIEVASGEFHSNSLPVVFKNSILLPLL